MRPFAQIADRIKFFRSQRRKTQVNLAKDASIDYRHFQKLEAGQSDFKVSTIFKLSEALEIPPCYLLQSDPFECKVSEAEEQNVNGKGSKGSEDHFCASGMLSQLNLGVVACNLEGKILFCNKVFADILEVDSLEELRSYDMSSLIPTNDFSSAQIEYQKSIIDGRIKSDFIRLQIQTPRTKVLKAVRARWNQVFGGKKSEQKGYVAAVWEDGNCRDLGNLPSPTKTT